MLKNGMKKGWAVLLALGLLWTAVPAPGSAEEAAKETAEPLIPALELPAMENGTMEKIPVDQDIRKNTIGPKDECYLYGDDSGEATGYADPSITVSIGRGRIYETNYVYARVKIADPSQIRAYMYSSVNSQTTDSPVNMASRAKAVLAINGDFCGGAAVRKGVIMRQGKMLRQKCDGQFDILVVDKAGDFHVLPKATSAQISALQEDAVNIFTFGPALIIDGVRQPTIRNGRYSSHKPAQRMAICQTGPLEYLAITCEGPEDRDSKGLTIEQFSDLVSSFPEIRQAYNLDGGSSSTVVFRLNGNNWRKINALNKKKGAREVKDIIYFVSAWEPAPQPSPEALSDQETWVVREDGAEETPAVPSGNEG